jgi:hypothetical protein
MDGAELWRACYRGYGGIEEIEVWRLRLDRSRVTVSDRLLSEEIDWLKQLLWRACCGRYGIDIIEVWRLRLDRLNEHCYQLLQYKYGIL